MELKWFPRRRCASAVSVISIVSLATAIIFIAATAALAGPATGIGLMGDSVLDEYGFAEILPPGGDRRQNKGVAELLTETRGLNFGPFANTSRGTPRNEGFEFNWAFEGSTTQNLIDDHQHKGLAAQVAAGNVNLAWIWVGPNDFRELFAADIIQGPDPAAAIQAKVVAVATNVQTAIQTLLAAHPSLNVVVANMPDLRALPALKAAIASTPGLDIFAAGVDQGIQAYNAQIAGLAASSDRIAMVDAYGISQDAVAGIPVQVGSLTLDTNIPGPGATHYFADVLHPGTAASGLLANAFIDASNAEFQSDIQRLTNQEIVSAAVPLPDPVYGGLVGLGAAAVAVARTRLRLAA